MPFTPCTIVEWGDDHSPTYPVAKASGEAPFLDTEPGDGTTHFIKVGNLGVYRNGQKVFSTENPSTVLISDRRLAFACPDYAKGSTWLGFGTVGTAVAVTAMAVSHVRAKKRAAGKCFVGQLRFPWISSIAWRVHKSRFIYPENIELAMMSQGRVTVTFSVGWGVEPEPMAHDLLRRVVSHRLASEPQMPVPLRESFSGLLHTPASPMTSYYNGWTLPHSFEPQRAG